MTVFLWCRHREEGRRFQDMRYLVLIRKSLVGLIGGVVLVAGIAMIPLPGPAFVFIPLGIWILSLEFAWAKRMLESVKRWVRRRKASK